VCAALAFTARRIIKGMGRRILPSAAVLVGLPRLRGGLDPQEKPALGVIRSYYRAP